MNSTHDFARYEAEASRLVQRIADLEAIGPEFLETRDQAQAQYERHVTLLSDARADLAAIRSEAAAAAMRLGERPAKDETIKEQMDAGEIFEEAESQVETKAESGSEGISEAPEASPAQIIAESISYLDNFKPNPYA